MHIFPDHFSKAIDLCNTYPACRTLLVSDLELPPIETIPDNDQRGKEIHIIHIMKIILICSEYTKITLRRFLLDAEKRSKRGIAQGLHIPKPKVFYLKEAATDEKGKYFFQTLSNL